MAQKKLLLILKLIFLFAFIDLGFAASYVDLLNKSRIENIDNLKKLMKNNYSENELEDRNLYVFISSSMPKMLLRDYYQQAKNYKATLVLKGLPKGSFRELGEFVMDISKLGGDVPIIIDDESFDRFRIDSVPSFVLYQQDDCIGEHICETNFDKVSGNIGIKKSIEVFAEGGIVSNIAKEYLK